MSGLYFIRLAIRRILALVRWETRPRSCRTLSTVPGETFALLAISLIEGFGIRVLYEQDRLMTSSLRNGYPDTIVQIVVSRDLWKRRNMHGKWHVLLPNEHSDVRQNNLIERLDVDFDSVAELLL